MPLQVAVGIEVEGRALPIRPDNGCGIAGCIAFDKSGIVAAIFDLDEFAVCIIGELVKQQIP